MTSFFWIALALILVGIPTYHCKVRFDKDILKQTIDDDSTREAANRILDKITAEFDKNNSVKPRRIGSHRSGSVIIPEDFDSSDKFDDGSDEPTGKSTRKPRKRDAKPPNPYVDETCDWKCYVGCKPNHCPLIPTRKTINDGKGTCAGEPDCSKGCKLITIPAIKIWPENLTSRKKETTESQETMKASSSEHKSSKSSKASSSSGKSSKSSSESDESSESEETKESSKKDRSKRSLEESDTAIVDLDSPEDGSRKSGVSTAKPTKKSTSTTENPAKSTKTTTTRSAKKGSSTKSASKTTATSTTSKPSKTTTSKPSKTTTSKPSTTTTSKSSKTTTSKPSTTTTSKSSKSATTKSSTKTTPKSSPTTTSTKKPSGKSQSTTSPKSTTTLKPKADKSSTKKPSSTSKSSTTTSKPTRKSGGVTTTTTTTSTKPKKDEESIDGLSKFNIIFHTFDRKFQNAFDALLDTIVIDDSLQKDIDKVLKYFGESKPRSSRHRSISGNEGSKRSHKVRSAIGNMFLLPADNCPPCAPCVLSSYSCPNLPGCDVYQCQCDNEFDQLEATTNSPVTTKTKPKVKRWTIEL